MITAPQNTSISKATLPGTREEPKQVNQSLIISNDNKTTPTKSKLRVEIYHLLACGHYNEDFPNPFEIRECQYVGLSDEDKRFSDRVNGKHTVKQSEAHSFDYDYSAICEECREKENERLRRRQPLKWPNATDTI